MLHLKKIKKLPSLSHLTPTAGDVCITCPLSKFTKKPYPSSDSRASQPFALVHIDIWGAYRVPTKGHYRYFLTIVDGFSRVTWIQLLKQKSGFFSSLQEFCINDQNSVQS